MTASIWTLYSERRPTKEDADAEGKVYIRTCYTIYHLSWDYAVTGNETTGTVWCRTADLDRATGYVKPRKLHSAWREPQEAQWVGVQRVWWLPESPDTARDAQTPVSADLTAAELHGWKGHWQIHPVQTPPVWEDDQ